MARAQTAWTGPAIVPALLLALAACAPARPAPSEPGDLARAAQALRRGDVAALRAVLGQGEGHLEFAAAQARELDPAAWLIVMGASWREHDATACAAALAAKDGAALGRALGFGEQHMRADVLDSGRTVYSRRAGMSDYFETGEAPLAALRDDLAPALPPGARAYELTWWGTRQGRTLRLRTARNARGLANLQASLGLAATAFSPSGAQRTESARQAAGPALPGLALDAGDEWWGIEVRLVAADGMVERLKVGRDGAGWFVAESSRETLTARLETERDRRLTLARRLAGDFERSSGRWPRYFSDLSLRRRDLVDPAAPDGLLGWAELSANPAPTLVLLRPSSDRDDAIQCAHASAQGRRTITRGGELVWR